MELKNKKIAIFAEDFYEDFELWYPYYRMKEAGAAVTVVAPKTQAYKSKHGLEIKADKSIKNVTTKNFDALIIPGGYSPDHMRRHKAMVKFVKKMYDEGKLVAAICHAGWMLASAGIIKNKKLTSFFSIKDDLINAGAKWLNKEVVVDGNLITSRNPDDLPIFCKTIIEKLKS